MPPPPPQVVAMTRISFSIDGTPADFPQTVLDNIAIAIATPAGVGITDVRVAVGTYSYGTDQYSASSAYSTLAEGVLLTAEIAHPSETERLVGKRGGEDDHSLILLRCIHSLIRRLIRRWPQMPSDAAACSRPPSLSHTVL